MAVPGPSGRTYAIDDNAGSAATVTTLIVGTPTGVGELEEILHDLTGPASTAAVILPVGFTAVADSVVTFMADVGGSVDPTTIYYVNRGASRLYNVTYVTGWTFSSESYIFASKPKTGVKELSLLEVGFRFTGAVSVT